MGVNKFFFLVGLAFTSFAVSMAVWSEAYFEKNCVLVREASDKAVLGATPAMVYTPEKELWRCHGRLVYR